MRVNKNSYKKPFTFPSYGIYLWGILPGKCLTETKDCLVRMSWLHSSETMWPRCDPGGSAVLCSSLALASLPPALWPWASGPLAHPNNVTTLWKHERRWLATRVSLSWELCCFFIIFHPCSLSLAVISASQALFLSVWYRQTTVLSYTNETYMCIGYLVSQDTPPRSLVWRNLSWGFILCPLEGPQTTMLSLLSLECFALLFRFQNFYSFD